MRRNETVVVTKEMVVTSGCRDIGKTFVITEMTATAGEDWAGRAWLAVARSGVEVPSEFLGSGWAGIAIISLQALRFTRFEEMKPLMDELMGCVQIMPDRKAPEIVRPLQEEDIAEVETRVLLKRKVFDLHTGPFFEGVRSKFPLPLKSQDKAPDADQSTTRTSHARSRS